MMNDVENVPFFDRVNYFFGQMLGVRSSSHARALFRKSLERSAPTGRDRPRSMPMHA